MQFSNHLDIGIDFEEELNQDQFRAVTAPDGAHLVLAGAGSGKTRTLTYRVAYLLSKGIRAWEILLLTFTNKSANEMLARVEELTGLDAKQFWGGTFHSIGQKILRRHSEAIGLNSNFTILDQGESESFFKEIINQVDSSWLKDKSKPKPKLIYSLLSYCRNTQIAIADHVNEKYSLFSLYIDQFEQFSKEYQKIKRERAVVDYDDLLEGWLCLLNDFPDICEYYQNRFRHILIDEYQDTNTLQSKIIDKVGGRHQIMAVGDDAQCIYTWRGANIQNIQHFRDRHLEATIHKIEINYRSTPEILNLANSIQLSNSNYFYKQLRAVRDCGELPILASVIDVHAQARYILRQIDRLMEEGYYLNDIAILYRAHYQSMDLQMELQRCHLPFQVTSGIKFFEQAHIKDFIAQIRIVRNSQDIQAFQRLVMLMPKIGEKTALRLWKKASEMKKKNGKTFIENLKMSSFIEKVPKPAREIWESMVATLADLEMIARDDESKTINNTPSAPHFIDNSEEKKPSEMIEKALEGWYPDLLKTLFPDASRREEDLNSLVAFSQKFTTVDEMLAQLVLVTSETSNQSYDQQEDVLRLSTIHQAKGLEYPIVFVIGLADEQFPLRRAIESGDLEEERRLFYVSVTRAKDLLYLTYPMMHINKGIPERKSPSRFLCELPTSCYQAIKIRS